jgi:hypothetical protein
MTGPDGARWPRELGRVLAGALCGAAFGLLLHLLLFEVGFARQVARPRLSLAWDAVIAWLAVIGAIAWWRGRRMKAAIERHLVPADLGASGTAGFALAAGFGALAVLHYHVAAFLLDVPTDLPSFLLASRAMADGADFYDPAVLIRYVDPGESHEWFSPYPFPFPYLYLPVFAVLLWPLAALPLPTAYAAALLVNATLWPILIYLCLRLVDPPDRIRAPLLVFALLLFPSFFPTIFTLHHGSPSLLVAVLIVGALVLERSGRSRLAGALVALAVLIKIVPVVLLVYLALRRRWRALLWAAVAAVALMAVSVAVAGVEPHVRWVTELAPSLASGARTGSFFEPACHPENQTFTSLVCRLLGAGSPWARPVASLLGALVLIVASLVLWRRRRPAIDGREGALLAVTVLLVSTITWFHHMTLMLPPLLALAAEACLREGWRRWVLAAVSLGIAFGAGFEFYLNPWTFVAPNPFTHTLRMQAMLASFVALLVVIGSERRGPSDETVVHTPPDAEEGLRGQRVSR